MDICKNRKQFKDTLTICRKTNKIMIQIRDYTNKENFLKNKVQTISKDTFILPLFY